MLRLLVSIVMLSFGAMSGSANASQIAVEYQQGEYSTYGVRVAVQPMQAQPLPWWGLYWYPEVSISQWQQHQSDTASGKINVVALSPVLRKPISELGAGTLSVEFGIGASMLDEREIGSKHLGTYFQFEDRIGLHWGFSPRHSIALRYMHYSNGGLGRTNPGMDFINLSYARAF